MRGSRPPDIVWHATHRDQLERWRGAGDITLADRPVHLVGDPTSAWRTAHRQGANPAVLVVDAARARRQGVRFDRHRRCGGWVASVLPASSALNLQPGFAEQVSAGGFPLARDDQGVWRVALVRVVRRNRSTWEVAKGKLEPGESPELAGLREVAEETGLACTMTVFEHLGATHYGFTTPSGQPRLKVVHLYLLAVDQPYEAIASAPATAEGIREVRWFALDDAVDAITHGSLGPVIRRVRERLTHAG